MRTEMRTGIGTGRSIRRPPGGRALHELRLLGIALQFLTRVPVRVGRFEPSWLADSARHFPLVGALVGAFGAATLWGAAALWPLPLAVTLSMAATAWITGGFHEDGLADTCDGLGGAVDREKALAIMKDSRLGTYGALGLLFVLALKACALWTLSTALSTESVALAAVALVLAHGVSRAAAVAVTTLLPYGGDTGHAKALPMTRRGGVPLAAAALGWTAAFAVAAGAALPDALGPVRIAFALGCAAAVVLGCAAWLRRRLGGYTGDTLGAVQQLSELAMYLALCALPGAGAP